MALDRQDIAELDALLEKNPELTIPELKNAIENKILLQELRKKSSGIIAKIAWIAQRGIENGDYDDILGNIPEMIQRTNEIMEKDLEIIA